MKPCFWIVGPPSSHKTTEEEKSLFPPGIAVFCHFLWLCCWSRTCWELLDNRGNHCLTRAHTRPCHSGRPLEGAEQAMKSTLVVMGAERGTHSIFSWQTEIAKELTVAHLLSPSEFMHDFFLVVTFNLKNWPFFPLTSIVNRTLMKSSQRSH